MKELELLIGELRSGAYEGGLGVEGGARIDGIGQEWRYISDDNQEEKSMEEDESWECVEEEERVWIVEKEIRTNMSKNICKLDLLFYQKKKLAFWNWKIAQENELCCSLCLF